MDKKRRVSISVLFSELKNISNVTPLILNCWNTVSRIPALKSSFILEVVMQENLYFIFKVVALTIPRDVFETSLSHLPSLSEKEAIYKIADHTFERTYIICKCDTNYRYKKCGILL